MFSRKDFVYLAAISYLVLILLFVFTQEKSKFRIDCNLDSGCVRFCCRNIITCNESFIRSNFDASRVSNKHKQFDFKIMLGEPNCEKRMMRNEDDWRIYRDGSIFADGFKDHEDYCFQDSTSENGSVTFDLLLCEDNQKLRETFGYLFCAMALVMFLVTIAAFALTKELRLSVWGKCEFAFVISFLFSYVCATLIEMAIRGWSAFPVMGMILGFFVTCFWMIVLSFDVWWTSKSSQDASDGASRFKFYCFYVGGLLGFLVLVATAGEVFFFLRFLKRVVKIIFLGAFLMNALFCVVFSVMAAVLLFRASKSTSASNHVWFQTQKDRFWLNAQMLVILLIASTVKLFSLGIHHPGIVSDLLMAFSALLVFIIFVTSNGNRKVFLERYRKIRS